MAQQIKKKFIDGVIFTEIDGKIDLGVQGAKDYADAQDLLKLQEGKDYADLKKSEALAYADVKKSEALVYADGKLVEAKTYADGKLVEGKAYTDVQVGAGVVEAKNYADAQDLVKLQEAKDYADTKKQEAILSAEAYADVKKSEAIADAHAYADQVKSDLLSGAGPAYDTLKKLEDALKNEDSAVAALTQVVGADLVEAKAYTDAQVLDEKNRALAAEGVLAGRLDAVEAFDGTVQGLIDAAVLVEQQRAEGAEAQVLVDAKAYADAQIAAIPAPDFTPYLKHDGSVEMTGDLLMGHDGVVGGGAPVQVWAASNYDGVQTVLDFPFQTPVENASFTLKGGMGETIAVIDWSLQTGLATIVQQNGNISVDITGYVSPMGLSGIKLILGYQVMGMFHIEYGGGGAGSPAVYNKIKFLADGIDAHEGINKGQLDAAKLDVQNQVSSEQTRAEGVEQGLQTQLNNLIAKTWKPFKKVLGADDLVSIQLPEVPEQIMFLMADDVIAWEGVDFVLNGQTITWGGDLLTGPMALGAGDVIYLKYLA